MVLGCLIVDKKTPDEGLLNIMHSLEYRRILLVNKWYVTEGNRRVTNTTVVGDLHGSGMRKDMESYDILVD